MERIKIFAHTGGNPASPLTGEGETYNAYTPEFHELYGKKGVYYIYGSENGRKPVYIGRSISDIGKTIARHFQNWGKATERKYTEDNPRTLRNMWVEVHLMPDATDKEIFYEEGQAIDKYKPRENMIKAVKKWKDRFEHYKAKTEQATSRLEQEQEQERRAQKKRAFNREQEEKANPYRENPF